jgi:hypothetical protein
MEVNSFPWTDFARSTAGGGRGDITAKHIEDLRSFLEVKTRKRAELDAVALRIDEVSTGLLSAENKQSIPALRKALLKLVELAEVGVNGAAKVTTAVSL